MGKAEDTKARVERAALTLFVARGVAETTTKEIAMAASIAEGTIYRYFPSKERLALDLFLRHHRALAEALEAAQAGAPTLREKIDAIVACYCEWADRDWTLFAYHLLNQHSFLIQVPEDVPNPVTVVREVISRAMRAGEIPSATSTWWPRRRSASSCRPRPTRSTAASRARSPPTPATSAGRPGRCCRSRTSSPQLYLASSSLPI
jgi:AcrR family transcriptional regulator